MCILLHYIYHDCGCLAKTGTYHCRDAKVADREWSADCPRYKKTEQVLRIGEVTCDTHAGLVLREGTPELEFRGLDSGESGESTGLGEGENRFDLKKMKEKLKAIKEKREARKEAERVKAEQLRAKGGEKIELKEVEELKAKESEDVHAKEGVMVEENVKTMEDGPEEAFASSSSSSDNDEMGYEGDTEDPVKKPTPVAEGSPSPAALAGSLSPRAFAASLGPRPASNPLSLGLRRITRIEGLKEAGSPTKKVSSPPPPPPPPKDGTGM